MFSKYIHTLQIVLMGASSDELKRIKCVIRCAVVMAYHFMLETSFLLDQTAMFSTISPQSHAPFTLDIPMFNGFHQNEPKNVMSSSEGASSISFQPYNPDAFLESSLSASIQKVMGDSFPLFSDTSERIDMQKDGYIPEFSDILNHNDNAEDHLPRKDEICAVLDSERILVLTSSRNASRGTICEKSHFSHIKFYRRFDVPLGKFLHHNLLNQVIFEFLLSDYADLIVVLGNMHCHFYSYSPKVLRFFVKLFLCTGTRVQDLWRKS